ncbi:MAG: PfkB family carbohydrate kinase [Bacteroidota bacterium]
MYDLTCIGHITHDKIVTQGNTVHMAGGTSFYFSHAVKRLLLRYHLVTALSEEDYLFTDELKATGIGITILPSKHTVYFENIYHDNSDDRSQRVLYEADSFRKEDMQTIQSKYVHLGPLLANDIPTELVIDLSAGSIVSLDVQGYLRAVVNKKVVAIDWKEKQKVLPYISILKASETEAQTLTGETNMETAAQKLFGWGVKEVVITSGSKGSLIYDGKMLHRIPAYRPYVVKDATGCGDTYMAGYLYQRIKGASINDAGAFGAAMATIKIAASGPFNDTEAAIEKIVTLQDIL